MSQIGGAKFVHVYKAQTSHKRMLNPLPAQKQQKNENIQRVLGPEVTLQRSLG